MTVSNGQLANQTTFNAAFLSRLNDSNTVGRIDLENVLAASGSSIFNVQRELNSIASYCGKATNGVFNLLPAWTDTSAGSGTDDLTERAEALTVKFNEVTGHAHSGTVGDGVPISAPDIADVPLKGYRVQGISLVGATGSSTVVTTQMAGVPESSGSTVEGAVTSAPYNKVVIRQGSGTETDDAIEDVDGDLVYARLTKSGLVWTLSYYVDKSGVETVHTLSGATDIKWYYQRLYNPLSSPPVYDNDAFVPSDNATADVIDATSTQRGLVSASAQSIGGAKTFTDTTQSTSKDTGAVILEGGLGVEKNAYIGGNLVVTGTAGASNLSGTNTGDVTLAAVGATPNANAASLSGQVLNLQPADSSFPGVMTAIAQTLAGVKTWVAGAIFQAYIATQRTDVATTATITALSSSKSFDKFTGSTATEVQGITAGGDGQHLTAHNGSSANITFKHQNAGATAADRIVTATGLDLVVEPNSSAEFIYDTGQSRWVVKSGSGTGSGSGGSSALPLTWIETADAPPSEIVNQFLVYRWNAVDDNYLWANVRVPQGYTAGDQIFLYAFVAAQGGSGTFTFESRSDLFQPGTTALATGDGNHHTDSAQLSMVSLNGTTQTLTLEVSDSSGMINGVAVAAGDLLKIRLRRTSDTATDDVLASVHGAEVTFS